MQAARWGLPFSVAIAAAGAIGCAESAPLAGQYRGPIGGSYVLATPAGPDGPGGRSLVSLAGERQLAIAMGEDGAYWIEIDGCRLRTIGADEWAAAIAPGQECTIEVPTRGPVRLVSPTGDLAGSLDGWARLKIESEAPGEHGEDGRVTLSFEGLRQNHL